MKALHMAAFTLVVVGALNWGLWGLLNYNLVASLLGPVEKLVYVLVGAAGVYLLLVHKQECKVCSSK